MYIVLRGLGLRNSIYFSVFIVIFTRPPPSHPPPRSRQQGSLPSRHPENHHQPRRHHQLPQLQRRRRPPDIHRDHGQGRNRYGLYTSVSRNRAQDLPHRGNGLEAAKGVPGGN